MKVNTDPQKIEEILVRGTEDVFIEDSLRKKLLSGKKLRIKMGIDPTGPKIHLGRAATLRKLKQFQDLGHKIVLIVGDFTAMIGDPSDKLEKRPMLTQSQIKENMKNYKAQIGKIIDLKKSEFHYNSKWLKKLNAFEISSLAESFTVQQMSHRRNFKERFDKNQDVSLREFLYPLFQGYDSVMVKSDVEIGGFDQLFNLKAGRIIQRYYGLPEQDVLTVEMLEGTDGRKMSTSWGNIITIVDEPSQMFGKIMTVRDELIYKYFKLCTDLSDIEIPKEGNPRDNKIRLAYEIVKIYHGEKKAKEAQNFFINTFQKKETPENIPEIKIKTNEELSEVLISAGLVKSKGEFKRLVDEGGLHDLTNQKRIENYHFRPDKEVVLKIGKKRFVKIKQSA